MGLVRAAGAAVSTLMGDQWREYCKRGEENQR